MNLLDDSQIYFSVAVNKVPELGLVVQEMKLLIVCFMLTLLWLGRVFSDVAGENITLKPLSSDNDKAIVENSREVLETHHATCQVITEQIAAKAQATFSRALKGVCHKKDIDDHFFNLESQLGDQVNVIKTILLSMEEKLANMDIAIGQAHRRQTAMLHSCLETEKWSKNQTRIETSTEISPEVGENNSEEKDMNEQQLIEPRQNEILRLNGTVRKNKTDKDVFSYYWRVANIRYKLSNWSTQHSQRSTSFYVTSSGYRMYLRMFPKRSGDSFFIHVGLTKGDNDSNLAWPFKLKHRISILDQDSENSEDISSRIWDPIVLCSGYNWQKPSSDNHECVGLGFPQQVLTSRNYILNDSIIIKLNVYLS